MNKEAFESWCRLSAHTLCNDWQFQVIDGYKFYFIINPKQDTFSLIKESLAGTDYEILIEGYKDYNGWAEVFHEETGGTWK